jgi:hypothetical protein
MRDLCREVYQFVAFFDDGWKRKEMETLKYKVLS